MLFGGETAYWIKMDGSLLRQCSTYRRAGEEEYWETAIFEWGQSIVIVYEAGVMAVDESLRIRWHTPKLFNDFFVSQEDACLIFSRDQFITWTMSLTDGKASI
jgi:hypothetical protein